MRRDKVDDLRAFIAVARERSFTKAAAQLGVSQSALSYTIRTLEARLGLRLLTRTTRSVSLTEAGERRLGEQVDKGMIAVRIGPDLRMAIVAAASYFDGRSRPLVPQDLTEHACIALRLPTHSGLYAWEFRNSEQEVKVRVHGQAVFNTV